MSRWLFRPRPNAAARARLVCFPYAGGSAGIFRPWTALLPPDVELVAARLPGREARSSEPPCANWTRLVCDLSGELQPLLDVPAVFFGHSFGAMLAFELARELELRGAHRRLALIASACAAPGRVPRHPAPLAGSSQELWSWVRSLNATPDEIVDDPDMRALLEPALRADLSLAAEWPKRLPHRLASPITVFRGIDDRIVMRDDAEAWRAWTAAAFRCVEFAGDHFFINDLQTGIAGELAGACEAA